MQQYCNGHIHTQNNIEWKSWLSFLPGKSGAVRRRHGLPKTNFYRFLLVFSVNFQLLENKREWQLDSRCQWLTTTLTGPSQTKSLTALLPGNPTVLEMARSGTMYEIQNVEVIMNIFIRSSSCNPKKTGKQPLPQTLSIVKKHIKSIPIKGVISSSWAKANGESIISKHLHSRYRHSLTTQLCSRC